MADPTLALATEFPAPSNDQWLRLVEGVLKGADFKRKLVGRTLDGLEIQPLYPKAAGAKPVTRAEAGAWLVAQRMDHPDPATANAMALADLEGGADALVLVNRRAPSGHGFGVEIETVEDLDRALSGVLLDLVHLRIDAGGRGRKVAEMLLSLIDRRDYRLADLRIDFGLDPIGGLASLGSVSVPVDEVGRRCGAILSQLIERGFSGRAFLGDGRVYHEAGASEAQELAAVLATGVAYLRMLEKGGHDLDTARRSVAFLLVADADEFLTIAKFRALRRLWARVEEACGLTPQPLRLHAETAWRMLTRRDPWVNLLRNTIATFSAGIGGADTLTVLPFTAPLGLPDAFARRLARNTQLILLDEANLSRVGDPAAGAGGFEALTDALCEKAWTLFQEIEREGGIIESLVQGRLQKRIATTRSERDRLIATRKEPITGTSEFPNIAETPVAILEPSLLWSEKAADPAAPDGAVVAEALPSRRIAEPYERLRDRADAAASRTGARAKIFLANLGPVSAFTARATFAKNFFEAGGIEAIMSDGLDDAGAVKHAFLANGATLVCICSSDEVYEHRAAETASTLRDAGASAIYLAGRPGAAEGPLRDAGVTGFIHAGCDVLEVLRDALAVAGA